MSQQRVHCKLQDGIARVSLDRADKLNALDLAMFKAIVAEQKRLARARSLRVVVLSGSGTDFCSGLDVKSVMSDRMAIPRLLWKWHPWKANLAQQVSVGWAQLGVPVIAAIHGRCWGGGMQIALGADIRIAHPQASFSIMEAKWGLIPDMGGMLGLQKLTSYDRALKLTMTAETFTGIQALDWGIVTEISESPSEAADALAGELLNRSPDALHRSKKLYRGAWHRAPGAVLARESWHQIRTMAGQNQSIAVRREMGDQRDWKL